MTAAELDAFIQDRLHRIDTNSDRPLSFPGPYVVALALLEVAKAIRETTPSQQEGTE